jgi:hypothetical protein
MNDSDNSDLIFLQAVKAIDSGNIDELQDLITQNPHLVKHRLHNNEEDYFKDPYLLWYVANNPIRSDKMPPNIVEITSLLVNSIKSVAPGTYQAQIDYTLGLVATGVIPRESGMQIAMMDVLIDAGASPGNGVSALANGNIEAARHLINSGGQLTLAAALCLDFKNDIESLAKQANADEKLTALTAAAYRGRADLVKYLLNIGTDVNGYPSNNSGFHSHATPLHQAVSSGSIDVVKLLVEAGASLNAKDKEYQGTPLEWADYMQRENDDVTAKKNFSLIESYLKNEMDE